MQSFPVDQIQLVIGIIDFIFTIMLPQSSSTLKLSFLLRVIWSFINCWSQFKKNEQIKKKKNNHCHTLRPAKLASYIYSRKKRSFNLWKAISLYITGNLMVHTMIRQGSLWPSESLVIYIFRGLFYNCLHWNLTAVIKLSFPMSFYLYIIRQNYFLICVNNSEGFPAPPVLPLKGEKPLLPWLLKAPNPPPKHICIT